MRIGLYGIYGVYNFGCEAIVRGACKWLRELYPDCKIIYFSYNFDYDQRMLANMDIEVEEAARDRNFFKRCINKGLRMLQSERQIMNIPFRQMMERVDMILSIGGDIYTIPQVLRGQAKYPYYNHLIDFCNRAIQCGKKVVVYGASVGPWGEYGRAIKYFTDNMKKYDAILCREYSSVEYLESLGFENALFFPDPAFQLGEGKKGEGKYIGINLSPLSVRELYGAGGDTQIEKFAGLLDKVHERFGTELLFIPHVLSADENDNDLLFMEKIRQKMAYGEHVRIADSHKGFMGIKEQIRNCHMIISARMHCAINAVEENVPTIFLAYSQKSIGMCDYVYGNKKWVVDIRRLEEELFLRMDEMWKDREKISRYLKESNQRIKGDYRRNFEKVKEFI